MSRQVYLTYKILLDISALQANFSKDVSVTVPLSTTPFLKRTQSSSQLPAQLAQTVRTTSTISTTLTLESTISSIRRALTPIPKRPTVSAGFLLVSFISKSLEKGCISKPKILKKGALLSQKSWKRLHYILRALKKATLYLWRAFKKAALYLWRALKKAALYLLAKPWKRLIISLNQSLKCNIYLQLKQPSA